MRRREFLLALGTMLVARPSLGQQLVDLNNASTAEIESLPGIGEKLAEEIINRRPYGSVDELLQIPRFGEKRLARIRDMVTLGEFAPGAAPAGKETTPDETLDEAVGDAQGQGQPGPAVRNATRDFQAPPGFQMASCWRCQESFGVEAGTEAGVCPYCGVRWALGRANP